MALRGSRRNNKVDEETADRLREKGPEELGPLSPESDQARRLIVHSLIEPRGRRTSAVFLGRDDYPKVREAASFLMSCLLMECLPRLVQKLGGEVVFTGQIDNDGMMTNAIQETITISGKSRTFVIHGRVFICLPGQMVVVSSDPAHHSPQPPVTFTVRSDGDPTVFNAKWKAYTRRHNFLRGHAFFADGEIIERKKRYTWDDILIPDDLKRSIQTHVTGFLRDRAELRRLGAKTRRGLVLAGPPGTGKTLIGKVLADTLDCSFMWVSPRHIGEDPIAFQEILTVARLVSPTVVFLEDLDLFAEDRDARSWMGLGELMNQLDGAIENKDVITVATTNRLEVVEKALRNRPGRFDRVLHVGEMDAACRAGLLRKLLAKATVGEEEMDRLVSASDGYTGAQVEELANTIWLLAVEHAEGTPPRGKVEAHDGGGADGDGNGDTDRHGDSGGGRLTIDQPLIEAALNEFQVELNGRMGFHRERPSGDREGVNG